jgi:hypothetical protein
VPVAVATVGDYRCVTLAEAVTRIAADGFILGEVVDDPDGYTAAADSFVYGQGPDPGVNQPAGQPVNLAVYDPASYPFPTCPPE